MFQHHHGRKVASPEDVTIIAEKPRLAGKKEDRSDLKSPGTLGSCGGLLRKMDDLAIENCHL
jgi:hypothetical protein